MTELFTIFHHYALYRTFLEQVIFLQHSCYTSAYIYVKNIFVIFVVFSFSVFSLFSAVVIVMTKMHTACHNFFKYLQFVHGVLQLYKVNFSTDSRTSMHHPNLKTIAKNVFFMNK